MTIRPVGNFSANLNAFVFKLAYPFNCFGDRFMVHFKLTSDRTVIQPEILKLQCFLCNILIAGLFTSYLQW